MGFLSGLLSPLLTSTSQAVAGKQQGDIQGFLEKRKLDQAEAAASLRAALEGTQMRNMNSEIFSREHPKPTYDSDRAVTIDPTAGTSTPVAGIEPKKHLTPKSITVDGKPVEGFADTDGKFFDTQGHPITGKVTPFTPPDRALVLTAGADGSSVYTPRGDAAGKAAPAKAGQGTNLPAPLAAKVGQFGEMLKKASDLGTLTDNLDVTVGKSATRDLAEHGIHIPFIGTLPGSKGVGSMLQSHSPEYSQYQAALSPFILAAAHALSGARINQDQVEQIRKSIELAPGDFANKAVRAQKEKNMIDLINSIGGSLPPDAIGAQEDQMDADAMTRMKGLGYRPAHRKGAAPAAQRTTTGASDSGGDINLGKASHAQTLWDAAVKLHGEAKVIQEYGPRPAN